MFSSELKEHLEKVLSEKIITAIPLPGGDINETHLLNTDKRKVVIKVNDASRFPRIFEAEGKGLNTLRESDTFAIPKVLGIGALNTTVFLILEYIDHGKKTDDFWKIFGRILAALHQKSQPYFGFDTDNYIGSLQQYNTMCNSASEFYITQRLEPQFQMAAKSGFSFSNLDTFYKNIAKEIPNEPSSLIHGDLWNGNYITTKDGMPCLIDPAVGYAPREMDIAMMHLFGGFNSQLFNSYDEAFPLLDNWKDRLPVWQLYYLLVHLNLFGSSYYQNVQNVIKMHL